MPCPHCKFEGSLSRGVCPRCGNVLISVTSPHRTLPGTYTLPHVFSTSTQLVQSLKPGDLLHQGRYLLREPLVLPDQLRNKGDAWLATDTKSRTERLVVLREVPLSTGISEQNTQTIRRIALRHSELGQYPDLPSVIDVFEGHNTYYIVYQHFEGITLTSLMNARGGALPEYMVAQYGLQLCEMLTIFSRQPSPFVHGSISPDTIIVSPDQSKVSLIHLPFFTPDEIPMPKDAPSSGYSAPEQARGQTLPASDLYTVAAIMHHAVTGYNPRERLNFFYPPARRLNPHVTQQMEGILVRELHLSISQRYQQPADIQADLALLIATTPSLQEETSDTKKTLAHVSRLSNAQLRELSRNRQLLQTTRVGLVALLALLVVFIPFLWPLLQPSTPQTQKGPNIQATQMAALHAEQVLEQQTFTTKGIGLSDGRFVFDTYAGRSDSALKQQAAHALQTGDQASAVNFFNQAVSADPTDGEAQIYNEDLHVLQSGSPYITIVLGLAFDKGADDLIRARTDTQGAFIAQYEINKQGLLPHGLKLRLLIDSSGANHADVATVAQFVTNRANIVNNPDHIVGVVGWPFSSQTINARDVIASAHLPLVSQTASSVKLTGSSPYFFRVNPPDNQQGSALGKFSAQQLHAKTIIVLRDPTDPYSVSLADAFTASATEQGANVINNPADYFTESTTTVDTYQKVINEAMQQKANLIMMAGFSIDAVRLAHALGNTLRLNPYDPTLLNLNIMGGDGLDTNLVLGQGTEADAQIAANFPQDMRRLIFSAFGDVNEWNFLNIAKDQQPAFFSDWSTFYQSSGIAANNAPSPLSDALLTNDAVQVIARAVSLVHGTVDGQATRLALLSLGQGNVPAYQGVSGRITFDTQGNPANKAVVVLDVGPNANGNNVIKLLQVVGQFR